MESVLLSKDVLNKPTLIAVCTYFKWSFRVGEPIPDVLCAGETPFFCTNLMTRGFYTFYVLFLSVYATPINDTAAVVKAVDALKKQKCIPTRGSVIHVCERLFEREVNRTVLYSKV